MDDEQLMRLVDGLAMKMAAGFGRTLTAWDRREIWRSSHWFIRHEGWMPEMAVDFEVRLRLRISDESLWADRR